MESMKPKLEVYSLHCKRMNSKLKTVLKKYSVNYATQKANLEILILL